MTSITAAAGVTPGPKSLPARFIGIITAPQETFQSVAAHPRWFGMLALTTLVVALFAALPMTTDAGQQAALDQQVESMKAWGVDVSDEMYAQMEKGKARMPYTTGGVILVVTPLVSVIAAAVLFAIFNAGLGGDAAFKTVYSVLVHAGAVSALGAVFTGSINYFGGKAGTSAANLGALLPMLPEQSFAANLLGTVDVFLIWYVIVLAIGLGVLYRRRTQPIAIALLSFYAIVALAIAIFKSRAGGA